MKTKKSTKDSVEPSGFKCVERTRKKEKRALPYHGAAPVHTAVREIISATPVGAKIPMSARLMVQILEEQEGLSQAMAHRLLSQIRKGAALHNEWKGAFAAGKFQFTTNIGVERDSQEPGVLKAHSPSQRASSPTSPLPSSTHKGQFIHDNGFLNHLTTPMDESWPMLDSFYDSVYDAICNQGEGTEGDSPKSVACHHQPSDVDPPSQFASKMRCDYSSSEFALTPDEVGEMAAFILESL